MRFLFFILAFYAFAASAQVTDFLPTQKTISRPFGLPIQVSPDGHVDFVTGNRDLVFSPGIQVGFDFSRLEYSTPKLATKFSLLPPDDNANWIEYRRQRYDYGVGIQALIKKSFRLGLAPFRGARFTQKRLKVSKSEVLPRAITLPKELSEIEAWAIGDEGSYQTYGGIQVYAGADLMTGIGVTGTLAWQNQFIVTIHRREGGVVLSVTEEKLERRSLVGGVTLAELNLTGFSGKQMRADFLLDFSDPTHAELYTEALKGKLSRLEEKLLPERRKIVWEGWDRSLYLGIPFIYGHTRSQGSYEVTDDEQDFYLEVFQHRKAGLIIPTSYQEKFVYHNDESILLLWTTDMKKSSPRSLEKHFFGPARAVGFEGFESIPPEVKNFGTVIGEVGVVITRDDVTSFSELEENSIATTLKARCTELELSCRKDSRVRKIIGRWKTAMGMKWEEKKKTLGILLVKEPVLLHVLLRGVRKEKEAYFKFLSDRYQSLEGLTLLSL